MIKNTPTDKGKHIADLRAAFEHRATWFYLLIEEARKKGLDENFGREAIHACGCFHGENKFTKTDDLEAFVKEFANENVVNIFEMEILESTADTLSIDFHYCPLVAAWQKLTNDESKIDRLCDIAMDGDRGIAAVFPEFEFELGKTIAKGDDVCQIRFKKK